MLMYVQRLAEEGFNDRLEQILLDLLGPAYPMPARSTGAGENGIRPLFSYGKDGRWESTVAGIEKRKLLREVLDVTGKFRELQAMNVQYHTALRDLEDQDQDVMAD
jgi:protein HIRA/HIR1